MDTHRAAGAIRDRMAELRLGPRDLRSLEGPSEFTVRRFLSGDIPDNVQARTLQAFDVALSWKRGSLRAVLFSGGEPTPVDDCDAARTAVAALGDDATAWCAIPRWMIQDLVGLVAELALLTRNEAGQVPETIRRTNTLAADMLAVATVGARSPEELAHLTKRLAREAVRARNPGYYSDATQDRSTEFGGHGVQEDTRDQVCTSTC
jgi:hypothetical protein